MLRILAGLAVMATVVTGGCQRARPAAFHAVVLGDSGGLAEDNLTSFLLARTGSSRFVALDAGTLHAGMRVALQEHAFKDVKPPLRDVGEVLRAGVRAYLLSHAHLDHVAGLTINATDDTSKPILALPQTLGVLQDHVFNWKVWPNFGDGGTAPLKRYALSPLVVGEKTALADTGLDVRAFPLSHGRGVTSTAFLVASGEDAVLYLGDTGPDAVEGEGRLAALWDVVAPLVKTGQLHAVFMEASYPNGRPDKELFGHLTPRWLLAELGVLAGKAGVTSLQGLKVVVTHVKPSLEAGQDPRRRIMEELRAGNELGVEFVMARQGARLAL